MMTATATKSIERTPNSTTYLRGHWLLGCTRQMQRDPLALYTRARRELGDHAEIRMFPGMYVHLLTHPDAVEHVLQHNHKNYRKPAFFSGPVRQFTGDGILTSEGAFWLKQRRLMQPVFHRQHLAKLAPIMVTAAEDFVRDRQPLVGQEFDILDSMMKLTLRVAGETLLGADISHEADELGRAFRCGFEVTSRRMSTLPLIPTWFPTPTNMRFARAKKLIDRVVMQLIAARRHAPGAQTDLLSLLLAAQDEEAGGAGRSKERRSV